MAGHSMVGVNRKSTTHTPAAPGLNHAAHDHDPYPTKIAFGDMRTSGVRDILVYCRDHKAAR